MILTLNQLIAHSTLSLAAVVCAITNTNNKHVPALNGPCRGRTQAVNKHPARSGAPLRSASAPHG